MKRFVQFGFSSGAALVICVLAVSGLAMGATQYVVTNDDVAPEVVDSVTFYAVGPAGLLTLQQIVQLDGLGIGGGFFGPNRVVALDSAMQHCVYASTPYGGEIAGVNVNTLKQTSLTAGSKTDGGTSNGIGLAINSRYLYASFTDSNTIGTFRVTSGCGLTFVKDVAVSGLAGGIVNGMAIHGNMMIATYTDGSIESFGISAGTPVSNGDKQYSTATLSSMDATYPNSIDITRDGHFAIFGDTSTSQVVEVSDLSSGKLTPTVTYRSTSSVSSSNIMLSPDETILYVVNTQGDAVSAMFFSAITGTLSAGCKSGKIRGLSADWSYLAGLTLISESGNGGGVFVAEYGAPSGIASVILTVSDAKCTLKEAEQSPFADRQSQGLLSISSFPPRSF
jgi:6-phosphogluconolactonase (cycloisomerase 2 family)